MKMLELLELASMLAEDDILFVRDPEIPLHELSTKRKSDRRIRDGSGSRRK